MARPSLGILAALAVAIPAHAEWHAGEAPVRFTLRLSQEPTHADAGYFVHIPDGGVLPRPYPVTHVFTKTGVALASYTLWHNERTGMGVVFAAPAAEQSVHVYVAGARHLNTWTPATGLTPSAILCADPDRGDMKSAARLGRLGRVGPRVHFRQNPGHARAPLCIPGDLAGHPWPCSFYLLAYLVVKDPGKTWIAPMAIAAQSEVRIDGKKVEPRRRIDKWGGTGRYMNLSAGLHRIEVFSACSGRGSFSEGQGVMWMTWAPPNSTLQELGGPRPDDVPFAGTSKWASRVVRRDEIARSGSCSLQQVGSRDGTPVALARLEPTHTYWFEDEPPLLRYELTAFTAGNPEDTTYTWRFSGDRLQTGARTAWLFPGARDNTFTLTAASGRQRTQATHSFFAHSTLQTDLGDASARAAFRDACLNMVRATPPGADPTQWWDESLWRNLFRAMALGESKALLAELFTKHWDTLKKTIPAARLSALEDRFIMIAPTLDPEAAGRWIERFEKAARGDRRAMLQVMRAEILMYYLDDLDSARKLLGRLAHGQGEAREWAKVRLGDLEFLAGNLNEATALYGEVQNRFKASRASAGSRSPALTGRVEDWKVQAILEASASETVRAFLEQAAYDEAYAALTLWERQFPMSKISGDLAVLESELYMALGHHRRAGRLLEAYCGQVDVSSFLPDAMGDLLTCMLELKEPDEKVRAFCEDARKRLKFHPRAERFEYRLRVMRGPGTDERTHGRTGEAP